MSPAPDLTDETIILSPAASAAVLNGLSSSDELDHNPLNDHPMGLGLLAVESMESIDLSDADEPPALTREPTGQLTTCSAPSTPTGERDQPVMFRTASTTAPTDNETGLPPLEVKYQGISNGNNSSGINNNGLFDSFIGCLRPFFSAMNKIGENIKYHKDNIITTNPTNKSSDDWEIPFDSLVNLVLIGVGIEGPVYHGKLNGQDVAFKRVKTENETNIKHLRKLNHANVIKFKGISIAPPLYYIVMEYCIHGSLYDVLKRRRGENSCTKPTQVLDWSRQIANGVNYLHTNKIVHRDLKSPNILIAENEILKISDFGTSKQLINRRSQIMSFNGTTAWMAPEVIRQEPCSEKIDVWSFGVVVWEILTCTVPYNNIDPSAVMWGVGKGSLTLPIPSSAPEGFKLLMTQCWDQRPRCRPSFQQIIKHLSVSEPEIILFEQEQEYFELQRIWSAEITEQLAKLPTIDISSTLKMTNDEIMKKRKEELQHIVDIRAHYQRKIQQTNTLYLELSALMMQLQQREREIAKKERLLNINKHSSSSTTTGKKRVTNPLADARRKSLQLMKAAQKNATNPMNMLSKINNGLLNTQPASIVATNSSQPISVQPVSSPAPTNIINNNNNQDSPSTKGGRRKKGPGHRRNNSKGSAASWTPPSMSAIAAEEKQRVTVHITSNMIQETFPNKPTIHSSNEMIPMTTIKTPAAVPSISAKIDSGPSRRLNPTALTLPLSSPLTTHQRPQTIFTYAQRKSSSSGGEDPYDNQPPPQTIVSKQRRRNTRTSTGSGSKLVSPSSITPNSTKQSPSDMQVPQVSETETNQIEDELDSSGGSGQNELRKHPRSVTFHLSPTSAKGSNDRSPCVQQRKPFGSKHPRYSSSEEGEVEEVHSDHYVLDDEKHRAKHEDLNRQSGGTFSSESEIYGETSNRSSLKSEGIFSDEGGHVSDDRPESRESLVISEPEHEWHDQE